MSLDLSFLSQEASKGASTLFQHKSLNNTQLWNLFDFLIWRVHQTRKYSIDSLIAWLRAIISHGEGFAETFCCASHKFVCGQTIKTGDPIYRCRSCQSDNNTLICVDCFKHSNHDGHDWFATYTNGSGCCDCGDPLSWDPKGFCIHHPGPSAGDHIAMKQDIEWISRLLCGYIIYIISHSFDDNHNDVIYISAYESSKNACFLKSFENCHPLKIHKATSNNSTNSNANDTLSQFMSSPLWGFFNRAAEETEEDDEEEHISQMISSLREEAQMEIDEKKNEILEDPQDIKQFEMKLKDIKVIRRDYEAFKLMQKESKDNDHYLLITLNLEQDQVYSWEESKENLRSVLNCDEKEAGEIAWKLRMFKTAIIAVGHHETMYKMQQNFIEGDEKKHYDTEIKKVEKDYCRVISRGLLMRLIEEIANWCNDSEILKRTLAAPMMANIAHLAPNYTGLKPRGSLRINIPPWNAKEDEDEDIDIDIEHKNDQIIVKESQNAFYFLILFDHVLAKEYLPFLSNLWYPLITLPPVKHRVSQIMATVYELMCRSYGETKRSSRHQFLGLTVQFLTIDPIVEICESHNIFNTIINSYIKLTTDEFHFDNQFDTDIYPLFAGHERDYKTNWVIATKAGANHIIFDQRYLFSVDIMMEYLLYKADPSFWRRYIMMIAVVQHSLNTHRHHTQHIQYEGREIINYLRFELNMFFANQRVVLNGLYQCIASYKSKGNTQKYTQALDTLTEMMYYGLTLLDVRASTDYFKDSEESNYYAQIPNEIKMKLSNFDGGYLENFKYFRTDRDFISLTLPLSRFMMNIAALYCEITCESFEQLMDKLYHKYSDTDPDFNKYITHWIDHSLRFITMFDQFHADLWIKNGDTFRTTIYNYERSDFWYIFYGAHFSLLQSFAIQIMSPSNLLTLLLHRYCLHNWFALNEVQLFSHHKLANYRKTGWKHWCDSKRTLKIITYALHTMIAIISEPQYCLLLEKMEDKQLRDKYNASIRYELIQWLILSPSSMSELTSKLYVYVDSESDKEEKLRVILNEIAVYQAPKRMEDTGKFVLKAQYYSQFNPYFKKYDRFNPGFIQASSDEQSEATEKYLKRMAQTTKQSADHIMFPNWPKQLISYSNEYQLRLLSAPYMGLIWNCTFYHLYINDSTRYNIDHVQQCLRLISMSVQVLKDGAYDLQSADGTKLIQNLTQCFDFRLSNKYDHVTDNNKNELMTPKAKKNNANDEQNNNNNANDENINENEQQQNNDDDEDDEFLISAKEVKFNLIEIHQKNEANVEGIGSVLWFLCKIFVSKTNDDNNEEDNDIPMTQAQFTIHHIPFAQQLLIEEIVSKLYALNVQQLMAVMRPLLKSKSFSIVSSDGNDVIHTESSSSTTALSPTQKRKRKRGKKAQERMLTKMNKKKQKFAQKHQRFIERDKMEEALEKKQRNELFGVGLDHICIVCKSNARQHTMLMMGFLNKCALLHRCVDNEGVIDNHFTDYENEAYLPTRKGMNFTFCGHFVHKECYDTFIINKVRSHYRREHYYGRGTLSINHFEFVCPYCKTVANMVVPLTKTYRNPQLKADKFERILDITKIEEQKNNSRLLTMEDIKCEFAHNKRIVFDSVRAHSSSQAFFSKLLYIFDDYNHDNQMNNEYLQKLGAFGATFAYVNTVSYTLASFEMMFRCYSAQQREDKLPRSISLMNTFISAAWSRCQYSAFDYLSISLLFKESWRFIYKNVLKEEEILTNDEEEEKCAADDSFEDPFIRIISGMLCHPTSFLLNEASTNSVYQAKKQTTLDFYQLILSNYIIKLSQLLLAFVMNENENNKENGEYNKYNLSDWQSLIAQTLESQSARSALNVELYDKMGAFLRKSLLVYNAFLNKSQNELLSVLWLHDIATECDLICDMLHLPTISNIVPHCWNEDDFSNYLSVINVSYVLKLRRAKNVNRASAKFQLISLPNEYNTLFHIAAETKCSKKGIAAIKSGMCLFCGKLICIDCCKNSVVNHCRECNHGIGVVLYLQKSSIILMWHKQGTQYESVFLDKYGESDCGLWRGAKLAFNPMRYKQLTQLVVEHLIPNKMTQIRKTNRDLLEMRLQL